MTILHALLDRITMYRLALYTLMATWAVTVILSAVGIFSYSPVNILAGGIVLGISCNVSNWILARAFGATYNLESASITGLILALIVGPTELSQLGLLFFIGFIAMATKYVLVARKHHLFNPAAAAVLLVGITLGQGASWWVGSVYTLPIIIIGGICMVTKAYRWPQTLTFIGLYLAGLLILQQYSTIALLYSPIWFFVFIMLSEPKTSPSTQKHQIIYGAAAALGLFGLQQIFPTYPHALETTLIAGNILAHILAPAANTRLEFKGKQQIAAHTWAFYFKPTTNMEYKPGQYIELTIPHANADQRGLRRHFTIASAPQESEIIIAARVPEKPSSFKQALMNLKASQVIHASGPYGDFILPSSSKPVAFIAGGIGITPFRSMLKSGYAENHDTHLLYFNGEKEAPFSKELLEDSKPNVHINIEAGDTKLQDHQQLIKAMPDFQERTFYISGPQAMVSQFKTELKKLGVKRIKTDYFPGYGG